MKTISINIILKTFDFLCVTNSQLLGFSYGENGKQNRKKSRLLFVKKRKASCQVNLSDSFTSYSQKRSSSTVIIIKFFLLTESEASITRKKLNVIVKEM